MKPVVLVTAIGTAASTTIVSALRDTNEFHIIGGDIYRRDQVATSKDVDEFYTFPSAIRNQDAYIDFVLQFCKEHKVSFYFPTIDEEVVNLSKNREKFEEIGVHLCIPNDGLINICHYKDQFFDWVEENIPQIAIKTYHTLEELKDEDFPVFIKPAEGRGSNGCQKIENRDRFEQLLADGLRLQDYVVQPFIHGAVISVDLVRNEKTGQKTQLQRVEELRNASGCGVAVTILNEQKLADICDELMEKLALNGVVNAEFFRTEEGYSIIEINPRFPAGTSFSVLAGCNTPLHAIKIAEGKACLFGKMAYGKHLAKRYEAYLMD